MPLSRLTDALLLVLFSLLLSLTALAVHSDGGLQGRALRLDEGLDWQRCGPQAGKLYAYALPPTLVAEQTLIDADAMEFHQERQLSLFAGDVSVTSGDSFLAADWASYDQRHDRLRLKGDLFYRDRDLRLSADAAEFFLNEDRGSISNIHAYRLPKAGARGAAAEAQFLDKDRRRFRQVSYTTCRPGNQDWELQAERVDLDEAEGVGVARHAKVRFKGVPIFYTPYLSFPIDDRRKSGFLLPSLSNNSDTGLDISTPYYLNLAPNYDATLTPRYMTERGLMLGGELRHINTWSRNEIRAEYLHDDKPGLGLDADRAAFSLRHWSNPAPRWAGRIHADWVSDDDYLSDFGSNLGATSLVHLERTAEAIYYGDYWNLTSRVQGFQTVDPNFTPFQEPYNRLPQFLLNAELPSNSGLNLHLKAEYVAFARSGTLDGQRLDLMPGISYPLLRPWGHFIPKLSLRHTRYELEDAAPGAITDPGWTLPLFSLDTGLVFEREARWFGRDAVQTLEPRLFYLNVPYEDQSDQPVLFDTAEYGMSFDSLFRDNRFVGADRQADANQLTAALTTRLFASDSGQEYLSASLGQTFYFEDRRVQLPGQPVETASQSALVGELNSQITPQLAARLYLQWDDERSKAEKGAAQLHYKDEQRRIFNLAYRYEDNPLDTAYDQEQVDTSFHLPMNSKWNLVGRWNYSLQDEMTLDRFAGIEYNDCCWAFRFIGRNYVNDDETTTGVFLQLELKGLGSIGHSADREIEEGVLGYRAGL
ncbi:MAG: LPS assembly protein LptD [Gammaproteobacteria bacterium SHHR-1]